VLAHLKAHSQKDFSNETFCDPPLSSQGYGSGNDSKILSGIRGQVMVCLKSLGKIFLMIPYTTHPGVREWGRLKCIKAYVTPLKYQKKLSNKILRDLAVCILH